LISQAIARRYAKALLALGQEDGNFSQYGKELTAFTKVMANNEVAEALTNPIYPEETRRKILKAILAKMGLSKIVENFLGLLMDKMRIGHIEAINQYFQRLVDEVNNVQRATILTAEPMGGDLEKEIRATLEKMTGKTIFLEVRTDPEIIGGIVAHVGDLTLDGSVKTQLHNLKEFLIKG